MSLEESTGDAREETIDLVTEDEATGRVAEVYAEIRAERDGELDDDLLALRDLGFSERELLEITECIALHVYTAYLQGIAGIVYPGMSREE